MIIGSNERLSRFLFDKKHFATSEYRVKHTAFMPPNTLRVSVYRSSTMNESEVWTIGDQFVAPARGKQVLGRADLSAAHVVEASLSVEPETTPHPLHADLTGWTADRLQQRVTALKLASKAVLAVKPT